MILTMVVGALTSILVEPSNALPPGSGSFSWHDSTGASDPDKPLDVYYYRPSVVTADTPVWLIMHGSSRNADDYRDYFVGSAAAQGALVIAPEFTKEDWPGSRSYNLGNISVSESNLTPRDEQDWSFSKIEPLFDYLVDVLEPDLAAEEYFIFGHSAGSQFTHRFLEWKPEARVKLAVAANAGWYTMAQFNDASYEYDWPYSLSDIPDYNPGTAAEDPFPVVNLENFLEREMVVLLGDEDTQRTSSLRQTEEADAQGLHRYARGQFFFAEAEAEATSRGLDFAWDLQIVEGVGHSGSLMAIPAAEIFRLANLPIGDYDQSGVVDSADYLEWKSELGMQVPLGTGADGNRNGVVDNADYLLWLNHLGAGASPFGGGQSVVDDAVVPEPASFYVLSLMVFIFSSRRTSRRFREGLR